LCSEHAEISVTEEAAGKGIAQRGQLDDEVNNHLTRITISSHPHATRARYYPTASATLPVVFFMMRLLTVAASASLALGMTRLTAAPYDIGTLGVAACLLYLLVRDLTGSGAARIAVALLVASLAPTLSTLSGPTAVASLSLSALASFSLLWWAPLILGTVALAGLGPAAVRPSLLLTGWWALAATVAVVAPTPWAAVASCVETAPAAALAGIAVARLADVAREAARCRSMLIGTLTVTCLWQAWLVLGTGRPARVLVPMLAAALMITATDLLTGEPRDDRDGVGGAIVLAMVVLGLVPGAHALVAQQHAVATQAPVTAVPGAETPSSISAP
jgi:hypothetical protein